jgi:hypothetical protein
MDHDPSQQLSANTRSMVYKHMLYFYLEGLSQVQTRRVLVLYIARPPSTTQLKLTGDVAISASPPSRHAAR